MTSLFFENDSDNQDYLYNKIFNNLKIKKYTNKQDTCAICQEEFVEDDEIPVLQCNHDFHKKCIKEWFVGEKQDCPMCKKSIEVMIDEVEMDMKKYIVEMWARDSLTTDTKFSNVNINLDLQNGDSVLHIACREQLFLKLEEILNEYNVNINKVNHKGDTALHCLIHHNKYFVQKLIRSGADINAINNVGVTPLHNMCWKRHRDCAEYLIKMGADINIRSNNGISPRDIIIDNEWNKTLSLSRSRKRRRN